MIMRALDAVRKHLDMPIAYLSAFEDDMVVFKSVSAAKDNNLIAKGDSRPAEGTYCQGVLDGTLPQLIPDTSCVPAAVLLPITHQAPVGAVVSVPVRRNDGSIYGMFCCLSPTAKPRLNTRDLEVMTMFAELAAEVVNTQLDEETQENLMRQKISDTIIDQNFSIMLQPIVSLHDKKFLGAEALSRFWSQPYASPDK